MATEADVVKVLRYMAAAWPRVEISEHTVAVYVMHMWRTGLAADVLLLAAMNLVDTMEFLPSVAEWRREAVCIQNEREVWYLTSNYRLHGYDLPERLALPEGVVEAVLRGHEPVGSLGGGAG